MKNLFILSLLVLMLLQAFSKMLIVVDYQANKEYIMEFLCINRDKPELVCEGKCYLQDKLKKHEQTEERSDRQKQLQEYSINLYCQDLFTLKTSPEVTLPDFHATYTVGPFLLVPLAFFQPPRLLV